MGNYCKNCTFWVKIALHSYSSPSLLVFSKIFTYGVKMAPSMFYIDCVISEHGIYCCLNLIDWHLMILSFALFVGSRWPTLFAFRLKKCTKMPMIWVNFLLIRLLQEGSLMQFDPKSRNLKFICLFWKRYVTQVQSINHWNLDSCLKHFDSIKATSESLK